MVGGWLLGTGYWVTGRLDILPLATHTTHTHTHTQWQIHLTFLCVLFNACCHGREWPKQKAQAESRTKQRQPTKMRKKVKGKEHRHRHRHRPGQEQDRVVFGG